LMKKTTEGISGSVFPKKQFSEAGGVLEKNLSQTRARKTSKKGAIAFRPESRPEKKDQRGKGEETRMSRKKLVRSGDVKSSPERAHFLNRNVKRNYISQGGKKKILRVDAGKGPEPRSQVRSKGKAGEGA